MKAISVKLTTPALSELMKQREKMGGAMGGLGEPATEIPLDHIHIFTGGDGQKHAMICMDNLIALVERTLEQ